MSDSTTIKVPKALRDRLARRAQAQRVPMAVVIERAVDQSEERAFWSAIRAEHAELSDSERGGPARAEARRDDLDDGDDDAISQRGGW